MPRLRLNPAIAARFPDYTALIIYARDLSNGPSDDASLAALGASRELPALGGLAKAVVHGPFVPLAKRARGPYGMNRRLRVAGGAGGNRQAHRAKALRGAFVRAEPGTGGRIELEGDVPIETG